MKINYVNADHVHALVDLPTNLSIEELIQLLKGKLFPLGQRQQHCRRVNLRGEEAMAPVRCRNPMSHR
jgi:REP element-mobilizing transposase RayT